MGLTKKSGVKGMRRGGIGKKGVPSKTGIESGSRSSAGNPERTAPGRGLSSKEQRKKELIIRLCEIRMEKRRLKAILAVRAEALRSAAPTPAPSMTSAVGGASSVSDECPGEE